MGGLKDGLGDVPWTAPEPAKAFDGETYEPLRDHGRMSPQITKVYHIMKDGQWRTLAELARMVDASEAGVSARLRDLRKPKYGSHRIERKWLGHGLFSYRLGVR